MQLSESTLNLVAPTVKQSNRLTRYHEIKPPPRAGVFMIVISISILSFWRLGNAF